jgi:FO synthase subunit 1
VTDDYINPDYAWPALRELEDLASEADVPLRERLPVYERYLGDEWVSDRIRGAIAAETDAGARYRACLSDERVTRA